jgi:hypothetical protein
MRGPVEGEASVAKVAEACSAVVVLEQVERFVDRVRASSWPVLLLLQMGVSLSCRWWRLIGTAALSQ